MLTQIGTPVGEEVEDHDLARESLSLKVLPSTSLPTISGAFLPDGEVLEGEQQWAGQLAERVLHGPAFDFELQPDVLELAACTA